MAVSKIAVMALVGILAIPILLGYAFNLSEVSVTDYKPQGDEVNVTDYLKTSKGYGYVSSDTYKINSDFFNAAHQKILPLYQSVTNTVSPMHNEQYTYSGGSPTHLDFMTFEYYYYQSDMYKGSDYIQIVIRDSDNTVVATINHLYTLYWDQITDILLVTYYIPGNDILTTQEFTFSTINNNYQGSLDFYRIGNYTGTGYLERYNVNSLALTYTDFSKGFVFTGTDAPNYINLPELSKSAIISINLDSITVPNYEFSMNGIVFQKTTSGSDVTWTAGDSLTNIKQLYYDSEISNNTYQVYFETTMTHISPEESSPGVYSDYYHYDDKIQLRYVGQWRDQIGIANPYITYDFNSSHMTLTYLPGQGEIPEEGVPPISFWVNSGDYKTPILRVDNAVYRGMEFPIISNKSYEPAQFKTNPSTTINNISQYGYAIEFGGNTYIVDSSGNITLGTHKVSVNGLKLESIPVPVGYENRINGNVVSVSSTPSDIKFSGQWVASVSTIGNTATTYNKTQWTPGAFGWDGIDTNFLIVGLITCLGVFIALGIYARKTGKGVIPLMIVCGGAAALFICMI